MSTFSFTNIAGEKASCSCTQYNECNIECSLYRKFTGKQTNADRIRAMTDEELAEWIAEILTFHNVKMFVECEKACPLYKCCNDQPSDNIEDWLKSPVAVDE